MKEKTNKGYFSLKEFLAKLDAQEFTAVYESPELMHNLMSVYYLLNQIRHIYGGAIQINSWYRNSKHNEKVGGVPTSQHLHGSAVDVKRSKCIDDWLSTLKECRNYTFLYSLYLAGIHQLIEYDTFVHIGIFDDKHPCSVSNVFYIDKRIKHPKLYL